MEATKAEKVYAFESVVLPSISSTFYIQIFRTNVVSAAFSSYVLALAKKLYKKRVRTMLMNLTT